jgi:hypothetical protein
MTTPRLAAALMAQTRQVITPGLAQTLSWASSFYLPAALMAMPQVSRQDPPG